MGYNVAPSFAPLNGASFSGNVKITGGNLDGVTIGGSVAGAANFTNLAMSGSFVEGIRTVTATSTMNATDNIIFCNHSAAITINLIAPTAGQMIIIKDKTGAASTNNVTIDAASSATIDGALTVTINRNYGSFSLVSNDGTNWSII